MFLVMEVPLFMAMNIFGIVLIHIATISLVP